jgi:hypothetical protein
LTDGESITPIDLSKSISTSLTCSGFRPSFYYFKKIKKNDVDDDIIINKIKLFLLPSLNFFPKESRMNFASYPEFIFIIYLWE